MENEQILTTDNTVVSTNEAQVTQYVDEFGNPIDPSLIDENGNYIGEQVVQYVDEFGNPIDPSLIDENGNYIGNQASFDASGLPLEQNVQSQSINTSEVANALNQASGNAAIETLDKQNTPVESASAHQMDNKELMEGMVTFDYNNVPITDIVNSIILDAINKGASDIHFDPFDDGIKLRIRIDGQLNDYSIVPLFVKKNMITRVKIISGMNITESRTPQDGAIRTEIAGKTIDLRVSCLPTNMGEKIVIRIMDYSMSASGVEALDFSQNNLEKVKKMLALPNGIILVTGATGSGKSTTVYSMLQRLNVEGTNLITVEDPIEMNIAGINQVQAQSEIGLTFATVLRSILRQDPDVIMIGEIRDDETARIAVRASITGHLVLSTIHTNNSLNTIERLTDMSVERYLLGTALSGVVSQKLARRLCPECKKLRETTEYEKETFKKVFNKEINEIYEPVGCPHCAKGYRGRIAIQEVLLLNQQIKDAITKGVSKDKLRKLVYSENGTTTMLEDGLQKVLDGKTSFDEILKLIDLEDDLGTGTQLGLDAQLEESTFNNEVKANALDSKNASINATNLTLGSNTPININISPKLLESLNLAGLGSKRRTVIEEDDDDEEIIIKPVSKKKHKKKVVEIDADELKTMLDDNDIETLSDDELNLKEEIETLPELELPEDEIKTLENLDTNEEELLTKQNNKLLTKGLEINTDEIEDMINQSEEIDEIKELFGESKEKEMTLGDNVVNTLDYLDDDSYESFEELNELEEDIIDKDVSIEELEVLDSVEVDNDSPTIKLEKLEKELLETKKIINKKKYPLKVISILNDIKPLIKNVSDISFETFSYIDYICHTDNISLDVQKQIIPVINNTLRIHMAMPVKENNKSNETLEDIIYTLEDVNDDENNIIFDDLKDTDIDEQIETLDDLDKITEEIEEQIKESINKENRILDVMDELNKNQKNDNLESLDDAIINSLLDDLDDKIEED